MKRSLFILGAFVHCVSLFLTAFIAVMYSMKVFPGNEIVLIVGMLLCAGSSTTAIYYFLNFDGTYGMTRKDMMEEAEKAKKAYDEYIRLRNLYREKIERL